MAHPLFRSGIPSATRRTPPAVLWVEQRVDCRSARTAEAPSSQSRSRGSTGRRGRRRRSALSTRHVSDLRQRQACPFASDQPWMNVEPVLVPVARVARARARATASRCSARASLRPSGVCRRPSRRGRRRRCSRSRGRRSRRRTDPGGDVAHSRNGRCGSSSFMSRCCRDDVSAVLVRRRAATTAADRLRDGPRQHPGLLQDLADLDARLALRVRPEREEPGQQRDVVVGRLHVERLRAARVARGHRVRRRGRACRRAQPSMPSPGSQ